MTGFPFPEGPVPVVQPSRRQVIVDTETLDGRLATFLRADPPKAPFTTPVRLTGVLLVTGPQPHPFIRTAGPIVSGRLARLLAAKQAVLGSLACARAPADALAVTRTEPIPTLSPQLEVVPHVAVQVKVRLLPSYPLSVIARPAPFRTNRAVTPAFHLAVFRQIGVVEADGPPRLRCAGTWIPATVRAHALIGPVEGLSRIYGETAVRTAPNEVGPTGEALHKEAADTLSAVRNLPVEAHAPGQAECTDAFRRTEQPSDHNAHPWSSLMLASRDNPRNARHGIRCRRSIG